MLELNLTLLFQVIGFFVLLFILDRLLYRPVGRVLEERRARIDGTFRKAEEINGMVDKGLAEYESKIKDAVRRGHEEKARLKEEALRREKEFIEAAGERASTRIAAVRSEIEETRKSALERLKGETTAIARDIAEKLLDRKIAIFIVGLVLLPAALSLASEGGEHGGGGLLWKVINFAILAVGVWFVWTKVLRVELRKRSEGIKKAMEEARLAKEEADRRAAEYRRKIDELDRRIEEVITELRLEGEAEKKRIIEAAEEVAERILRQAGVAAEQEVEKARLDLRSKVAEMTVNLAREIIEKEIRPEDHERLLKRYIEGLRFH